ncbi:hypothetical protein D6774_03770 [Candidatus Woesearchaeota archaeon]|nr:MAG: hypothetical protein D6774_03770 [Candidatus Woesearchaeota archaeon]
MTPREYLLEWLEEFLKHKDVMLRRIVEIQRKDDRLLVKEKERTITYVVCSQDDLLEKVRSFTPCDAFGIALYNTAENIETFIKVFDELAKYKQLIVHFINPFSEMQKRWTIIPHTHAKIADPQSFEMGIKSLAEGVEQITKEELLQIIEQSNNE